MGTDTFFNTTFKQFNPMFFEEIKEEKSQENIKLIKCQSCKKGLIYLNDNLFICPICKGHSKLIINVVNGKHYHLGEITDIHTAGDINKNE